MNHKDAQLQEHSCQHTRLYDDGSCADCNVESRFLDERHSPNTPLYEPKFLSQEEVDYLLDVDEQSDLPVSKQAFDLGMTQAEFDAVHTPIPTELYNQLNYLGLIPSNVRATNVGKSDYATKLIQPWSIFLDNPELNYMECDLIKRIIRTKSTDTRKQDLIKCQHIIDELIRQIDVKEQT